MNICSHLKGFDFVSGIAFSGVSDSMTHMTRHQLGSEPAVPRYFSKWVFLKILQYNIEKKNTCVGFATFKSV